jgi:hypothetical protein
VKLYKSKGKPKAGDYEPHVQALLKLAIFLFRGRLSTVTPFPDPVVAMGWAKDCWEEGCKMCENTSIPYNSEVLKLVSRYYYLCTHT